MAKKIILMGDSITQGLGSKKINFTKELQKLLGDEFVIDNMALTGTTIKYANKILADVIKKKPHTVIIMYGNVDAQIRPNREGIVFKRIPKRFQKSGMLMPRPFYSRTLYKKWIQKFENILRFYFSKLIYLVDGSEQWVDLNTFELEYREVVDNLISEGINVVLCSTVYIDERLFPGSLEQYVLFNDKIKHIAQEKQINYVDFFDLFFNEVKFSEDWEKVYCYDHFHPNSNGYNLITEKLYNILIGGDY